MPKATDAPRTTPIPVLGSSETVLALLGVAVGALVQQGTTEGPFGIWDTMVGGVIAIICGAFYPQMRFTHKREYFAFSAVWAFALIFTFGFVIDIAFFHFDADGAAKWSPVRGYEVDARDAVVFICLLCLTLLVYFVGRGSSPTARAMESEAAGRQPGAQSHGPAPGMSSTGDHASHSNS